jgi:nicotinate-nucleotide pyrophosphorylase (carboxylating)
MEDIRDVLFEEIASKRFRAVLMAERSGVLSGVEEAYACARELGLELELCKAEGAEISHRERFGSFLGTPKQIAMAEERLIGTLAKASGIATAARTAVQLADGRLQIVSGSWKKMPPPIKDLVRKATASGGAAFRICQPPMVYLDKNFIRMFGSIPAVLEACRKLPPSTVVVQIRGMMASVEEETRQALVGGAGILMVDTGELEDVRRCIATLEETGGRDKVKVAFAGNVRLTDIPDMAEQGIDILCIGKEIVDAKLLDLKLDVLQEE